MNSQLTIFPELEKKEREYIRDRSGKFASKEQLEMEEAKRNATYYKLMYEAERRKLKPVLKRLIEAERKLNELKNMNS